MKLEEGKGRRLNWRQACELLGCGKRKFYSLVKTGRLRAWRIADSRRGLWVWEKDVRELVKRAN